MKALVLAAGYGTRLLPYTRTVPKPLFTVAGEPLIEILIRRLAAAGCEAVVVNTHHLHEKIAAFISERRFPIPVTTRFEPQILGTGGAIRNVADFWDRRPFMVVNSDILTDIDFGEVYRRHLAEKDPATLVLYDDPAFNTVMLSTEGRITGFDESEAGAMPGRRLTFSGIQVLNPEVIDYIPKGFSSSIDAYRRLLSADKSILGLVASEARWSDLGTPERYREACIEVMAEKVFGFEKRGRDTVRRHPLSGDGSDRRWYRLVSGGRSMILADHGIHVGSAQGEAGAFEDIGRHLHGKGVAVPRIQLADRFSGLVLLEDLGDRHLQDAVLEAADTSVVADLYRQVIDRLIPLWLEGKEGFDPRWTWQTERYDREMILKAECGYFRDAFLRGYLAMSLSGDAFRDDFERIAEGALNYGVTAFMHRDMQSRNIMMTDRGPHFIDFQGGRFGPIQYDLAALLIDPYVALPEALQERLMAECADRLEGMIGIDRRDFVTGYRHCCIARNLQMLGAFGFLTRVKRKKGFEPYIPRAIQTLWQNLTKGGVGEFPELSALALDLKRRMDGEPRGGREREILSRRNSGPEG